VGWKICAWWCWALQKTVVGLSVGITESWETFWLSFFLDEGTLGTWMACCEGMAAENYAFDDIHC